MIMLMMIQIPVWYLIYLRMVALGVWMEPRGKYYRVVNGDDDVGNVYKRGESSSSAKLLALYHEDCDDDDDGGDHVVDEKEGSEGKRPE